MAGINARRVVLSAFILSGVVIARTGLGKNPLRTLMIVNLVCWVVAALFTIQSSIVLLAIGCFMWMLLGPYAEAAEQTTLQKVVPFERQGRVFGFGARHLACDSLTLNLTRRYRLSNLDIQVTHALADDIARG